MWGSDDCELEALPGQTLLCQDKLASLEEEKSGSEKGGGGKF